MLKEDSGGEMREYWAQYSLISLSESPLQIPRFRVHPWPVSSLEKPLKALSKAFAQLFNGLSTGRSPFQAWNIDTNPLR